MAFAHVSLLILSFGAVAKSAAGATCSNLRSDDQIELEKPKMEQVEWGMGGQGVKVKLSWSIPSELEPCLKYVQVVRKTSDYKRKTYSAPYIPDPAASKEMVIDMSPGDTKDTFILATFALSGGRTRRVMTPDTWVNPISCAQKRPKIQNLTLSQTSPGKVHLSWDLSGTEECEQFYFTDVMYRKGPYDTDSINVEVFRVPKGQKEIDLDVPKDKLFTYMAVVAKEDEDMSGVWYEESFSATSFITTDQGGCTKDFREPRFVGDKAKARMTPLPRRSGEQQKILLDWSHLKVSNRDCVTYFIVRYWPTRDRYKSETIKVPSNQTSVELELKDTWNGRPGQYEMKIAPSWRVPYWDSDWDKEVTILTANL